MMTREQINTKMMSLIEPMREQPEHEETSVHYRVDQGDRWYITILVEDPSAQRLLVALAFVHASIPDSFPGCSVSISGSVQTLPTDEPIKPKPKGLRSKLAGAIRWLDG